MFEDFKNAYYEMMNHASEISTSHGDHVVFPKRLFEHLDREFNICFVEPEDDEEYQLWAEDIL